MTEREALKLAKQLISNLRTHSWTTTDEQYVLKAIDEALAQPEQEPIGTVKELFTLDAWERLDLRGSTQVYTTPPQRKPLTDDLYNELLFAVGNKYPNETRHQTALRYILQAEEGDAKAVYGIKE